ncbi:MAG: peptidoglycan-binding protein [Alphaproteobacteria bacterium]|nr:peptidoglycan-binding protein [Alphaproteobacteria bacterium]
MNKVASFTAAALTAGLLAGGALAQSSSPDTSRMGQPGQSAEQPSAQPSDPSAAGPSSALPSEQASAEMGKEGVEMYIDPSTVRQIQQALNEKGFDVGEANGEWTQQSADAMRKFQESAGLDQTGNVNFSSIAALNVEIPGLQAPQTAQTPEPSGAAGAPTPGEESSPQQGVSPPEAPEAPQQSPQQQ